MNRQEKLEVREVYRGDVLIRKEKTYGGLLHGTCCEFYDNGDVKSEICYYLGKLNGRKVLYNKDGQLISSETYCEGVLHGKKLEFSQEGLLHKESMYVNGRLHGHVNYYNDAGKVIIAESYQSGILMATEV